MEKSKIFNRPKEVKLHKPVKEYKINDIYKQR